MGPSKPPEPKLEDYRQLIDAILAPVFGPLSARKVVMSAMVGTSDLSIKYCVRQRLQKKARSDKFKKMTTRKRFRNLENSRYEEIVNGRTG